MYEYCTSYTRMITYQVVSYVYCSERFAATTDYHYVRKCKDRLGLNMKNQMLLTFPDRVVPITIRSVVKIHHSIRKCKGRMGGKLITKRSLNVRTK